LKSLNIENPDLGVASQNLIEELYDNLLKVKENNIDVAEIADSVTKKKSNLS
jgi:hypothetical protein